MDQFSRPNHSDDEPEFEQLCLDVGLTPSSPFSEPSISTDSHLCAESRSDALAHYSFGSRQHAGHDGERPRSRFPSLNISTLSTGDLLTLMLRSDQKLGLRLLNMLSVDGVDPLRRLRTVTVAELTAVTGIGPATGMAIAAAVELGKRIFLPTVKAGTIVDDPKVAADVLAQTLMWQEQEKFAVVLLDTKHHLLGTKVIFIGSATETIAHPADVFRVAIRQGATRIIVAHNHPTGVVEPSDEDLKLTKQLLQAGTLLDIPVLDHLILGQGKYCSIRQTTKLWGEQLQQQ